MDLSADALEKFRVNREADVENCLVYIAKKSENLCVVGERGVGKTFLLKILVHELKKKYPSIFSISLDLTSLFGDGDYSSEHLINSFPRLVLLQLCQCIWTDLLQLQYSDLFFNELNQNELEPAAQKIHKLYNTITSEHRKYLIKLTSAYFLSEEIVREERTRIQLLNFEFFELIKEIKKDVLRRFQCNKIIVFCDEGNHLAESFQAELLQKYVELFNDINIQFVFVLSEQIAQKNESYKIAFPNTFHLKGFNKWSETKTLIENCSLSNIKILDESYEVLHAYFQGHPRDSLEVANLLLKTSDILEVTPDYMLTVCKKLLQIKAKSHL